MKNMLVPNAYFVNIDPLPAGSTFWLIELRRKSDRARIDSALIRKTWFFLKLRMMLAIKKMLRRQAALDAIIKESTPQETPSCPESKTENSPKPISDAT